MGETARRKHSGEAKCCEETADPKGPRREKRRDAELSAEVKRDKLEDNLGLLRIVFLGRRKGVDWESTVIGAVSGVL